MAGQSDTVEQEEIEFQEKHRKAWDEVGHYRASCTKNDSCGSDDPQYRLAPDFFQMYLNNRPSEIAARALETAFMMWGNLKGISGHVQTVLQQLSYEEDVWDKVSTGLINAFYRDGRIEESLSLIEQLVQKVIPLRSRSILLFELAQMWVYRGENLEEACQAFEQVVVWNTSEWHVNYARGYIYEIEHLGIGQPAPLFKVEDINGHQVELAVYRGKIMILHFWSARCGPCTLFYPHLRKIVQEYPEASVCLIGFSEDQDVEEARRKVEEEHLTWPQICEGNGENDTVFKLYRITGIPAAYILDQSGNIAFKIVGGDRIEEVERRIRSLISEGSNVS